MKRNVLKILTIIALISLVVFSIATPVFAADTTELKYDIPDGTTNLDSSGAGSSIARIIGAIINIVQVIGVGVAVIMLIVLAIKYISAAPNDKAEIKKHAVVYVVGAIILFAATGILQIIKNFAGNIHADQ